MVWLLLAGLSLFGFALLGEVILGVRHAWARVLPYLLGTGGSVLLVIVGSAGIAGGRIDLGLDSLVGFGTANLTADPLSGLFLVISFAVAVPVSLACAAWAREPDRVRARGLGAAYALVLASVALIVTVDNVFCFLFAWETLTLAFYLITAHRRRPDANPAVITVVLGKISGAALLIGWLLLAAQAHSFTLPTFAALPPSAARDAAFALLVLGFATKVGLVPVHIWIPRGYRAAPGPLRAVMAGVAVNVGFYGLWRTLDLLHQPPTWLVIAVLGLGGVTALLGIAHATVQTDLTEVIAYSSIENAGLIVVGYGVALVGAALHTPPLVAVGLLAATLQTIAHALAKSLLFTATATIEDATGTTRLDDLRGIGHRLGFSGTGLAVGSLTLAGLPLTAGFVSEWFLLEALMQQFRVGRLGYSLPLAIAGALVALTTGFAAVAFVRIIGLTVLGPRGAHDQRPLRDTGTLGKTGLTALAVSCFGIAAVAPLEVKVIAAALGPILGQPTTAAALKSSWVLQPVYAEFSSLSPSRLAYMLPLLFLGAAVLCFLLSRRRMFAIRRVPAWRSASGGTEEENQYKPFAFTNPTRKVLATVLLTRTELRTIERQTGGRDNDTRREPAGAHLGYTNDVIELVEQFLYRPLLRPLRGLVRTAKRLQNGRLEAYITYMLLAVLAMLALILTLT